MRRPVHDQHFRQALLWAEVARRTTRPADVLPDGDVTAVVSTLWRKAIGYALLALCPDGAAEPAAVWQTVDTAVLTRAAGGREFLSALRELVLDPAPDGGAGRPDDPVAIGRLEEFFERLIEAIRRPERERARRRLSAIGRVAIAVVSTSVAAAAVSLASRGPDLLAGRAFKTSSSIGSCNDPRTCGNAFFHTQEEGSPWIEYDLGATTPLHEIEIANRTDCCSSRATPLAVELSNDEQTWSEAARREEPFSVWTASLSGRSSRYVRIRAQRRTTLHLHTVVLR
jgi:hypothetical protein